MTSGGFVFTSPLAERVFGERYAFTPIETWSDASRRTGRSVAAPERMPHVWKDQFSSEIVSGRFVPGGRIMYSAGRPKPQMLNCFGIPTADSCEGWGKTVSDVMVITGMGGGVGMNFSPIRHRDAEIRGHTNRATGAVSLMEVVNAMGDVIRGGGGRKIAMMMCLNHDHPDIPEFLNRKLDSKALNNTNVSVVFMNESIENFLKKVEGDEIHYFMWRGQPVGQMPARELWQQIINNAVACGEPGILHGWAWNEESNVHYYAPCVTTNPCGEIPLVPYDCCCLGAQVLPSFVRNGQVDWGALTQSVQTAVRFLDNVLDVTYYPITEIKERCQAIRRIGLGVMGLHDMLVLLGMRYTDARSLEFVDYLFDRIKLAAYMASIELAREKGAFPEFRRDKFVESGFCKRALPENMKELIWKYGIRNCAIMTIAPTGTTSMVALGHGVTSGIEPMPFAAWRRRFRSGDGYDEAITTHMPLKKLRDAGDPRAELYEGAQEISVESHLAMQAACQWHIDNSVSKTINVPHNYVGADIDLALRKYAHSLKGVTIYREGSRKDAPLEPVEPTDCHSGQCAN